MEAIEAKQAALIRPAVETDFPRIAEIYAFEVLNGTATFEIEPPDATELQRRHEAVVARDLPWVVAELDRRVVGYAYAALFRTRPAYDWTLEDSVYLAPECRRRGVGRALLSRVVEDVTRTGYRQMLALIGDSANSASIGLHAALGFQPAGVFRSVGFKFERWLDVVLMQLALGAGATSLPSARPGNGPRTGSVP